MDPTKLTVDRLEAAAMRLDEVAATAADDPEGVLAHALLNTGIDPESFDEWALDRAGLHVHTAARAIAANPDRTEATLQAVLATLMKVGLVTMLQALEDTNDPDGA